MRPTDYHEDFETLLSYLRQTRGFDFTGYKRASLMRRVQKRMLSVGVSSYTDYVDYLEVHPDEFAHLFNTILINVTSFFRDAHAWDYVEKEVLPRLLSRKHPDEPIRVWSAGCATGEEAYTLAILLAEAVGFDQFQQHVKIYATDIDDEALARARQATYAAKEIESVPPALVEKYFESADGRYTFRKEIRRCVIFGRHDLIQDAPISRIDLLVCRNALMYFNSETQARILARFHFALNDHGLLFLGRAEMLFTHSSIFAPVDLRWRVFSKIPRVNLRDRLFMINQSTGASGEENGGGLASFVRLRDAALDTSLMAQVVVDVNGTLVLANELARTLFDLESRDVGRPLQDLEMSYRPVELRSMIERAYMDHRPYGLKDVNWPTAAGEHRCLDVHVVPLMDTSGAILGASLTFADVTRYRRLQEELEHANQELETAYEELQSTNEELETTNEELQSTVEELETTNEELQSTNEELETMNEELQSTNEELQTINDELRRRSDELNDLNAFMASVLTSLRGAVVVVDRDLRTLVWNRKAEDLWGLRSDEVVDRNFLNLDIGLPVERLRQPIRVCLTGESTHEEAVLTATNRRGRAIQCKTTATPLVGTNGDTRGVILVMEEMDGVR